MRRIAVEPTQREEVRDEPLPEEAAPFSALRFASARRAEVTA